MLNRTTKSFLFIFSLLVVCFSAVADSWVEINLDDITEFNNRCEYRITSQAYGNGQSVLKSHDVNPAVIRFYIGGIHNPGYIEATNKRRLCTDVLELPSCEACRQECIVLDSVISMEELCQQFPNQSDR